MPTKNKCLTTPWSYVNNVLEGGLKLFLAN